MGTTGDKRDLIVIPPEEAANEFADPERVAQGAKDYDADPDHIEEDLPLLPGCRSVSEKDLPG